jgi:hypothetical protein
LWTKEKAMNRAKNKNGRRKAESKMEGPGTP